MSFNNIGRMIRSGRKHKAEGVLNTDWGDSGHINLTACSVPGMIYGAALSWNPDDSDGYEETDRKISILEFGESSGRLVGLVRELCRQDKIIWNVIAFWRDEKVYGKYVGKGTKAAFEGCEAAALAEAVRKADEITDRLLAVSNSVPGRCKQDMEEFHLSARGVALMQALSLVIKKFELKEEIPELPYEPCKLAEILEYWFYDFAGVWRRRNKEAELYRIKEAIMQICDILRNY